MMRFLSESQEEHTEEKSHKEEDGHADDNTDEIILLLFLILIVGLILKQFNKSYKIAYTPLLLIFGLLIGFANEMWDIEPVEIFSNTQPHSILLLFLPPLVFESSFNADWHIFKRELYQILLLAIPGVLIGAVFSAITFKYILVHDCTTSEALLFGSILSATDPVAVVALLKELGVSKRFSTLIEGESLFNDGTAMVLFVVMLSFCEGNDMNGGEVILKFCRLSFGGLALGIVGGIIIGIWVARLFDESVLIIALTVSTSYLIFYLAEMTVLEFSGVLAVVAFGLYMSTQRTSISVFSEKSVHDFWSFGCFVAETAIFAVSGIIIGSKIIEDGATWMYLLKLFGLYFLLHIIRFLICIILWPLLRKTGYGLTFRQILVLVYGGLRGAVGLALAMIVATNHNINETFRHEVLFYTSGIATLTIFVNGNTAGFLMNKLGITSTTIVQKMIMGNILSHFKQDTEKSIQTCKTAHDHYKLVQWDEVWKIIGTNELVEKVEKRHSMYLRESLSKNSTIAMKQILKDLEITENALEHEARHRFITIIKGNYFHNFEEGQTSENAVKVLRESADRALDIENRPLSDWKYVHAYVHNHKFFKVLQCLSKLPCFGTYFQSRLYHKIADSYELAVNFIECHQTAENLLVEVIHSDGPREKVIMESKSQRDLAEDYMNSMNKSFPEVSVNLQNKRAAYYILIHQKHYIDNIHQLGELDDKEAGRISDFLTKQLYKIHLYQPKLIAPDPIKWMSEYSILHKIFTGEEIEELLTEEPVTIGEREYICKAGEPLTYVYAVFRGCATCTINHDVVDNENISGLTTENYSLSYKQGDVIGLLHLFHYTQTPYTDVIVNKHTPLLAYRIPIATLQTLISEDKEKSIKYWTVLAHFLIPLWKVNFNVLSQFKSSHLHTLIFNCTPVIYELGDFVKVRNGFLLLFGKIQEKMSTNTYEKELSSQNISSPFRFLDSIDSPRGSRFIVAQKRKTIFDMAETGKSYESPRFVMPHDTEYIVSKTSVAFILPEYLIGEWNKQSLAIQNALLKHAGNSRISLIKRGHAEIEVFQMRRLATLHQRNLSDKQEKKLGDHQKSVEMHHESGLLTPQEEKVRKAATGESKESKFAKERDKNKGTDSDLGESESMSNISSIKEEDHNYDAYLKEEDEKVEEDPEEIVIQVEELGSSRQLIDTESLSDAPEGHRRTRTIGAMSDASECVHIEGYPSIHEKVIMPVRQKTLIQDVKANN